MLAVHVAEVFGVQFAEPAVQETSVAVPVIAAPLLPRAIAVIVTCPGALATAIPMGPMVASSACARAC
jgi:hypothetical protein